MKHRKEWMVVLLAVAGAGVDAMMILGFNVLTAAQTGNTILLAVAVARGDFGAGLSAGVSLVAFLCGTFYGAFLIGRRLPRGSHASGMASALGAECGLLAFFLAFWQLAGMSSHPAVVNALVGLAATAMGVQSAVALSLHARSTTYITGILAGFTTGIARRWNMASGDLASLSPSNPENPWINGLVWLVYAASAVICGFVFLRIGPAALSLPLLAVLLVVFIELKEPSLK